METKICSKCQEEKPIEAYAFKFKEKGIHTSHCRACQSLISATWYKKNKKRHLCTVKKNGKRYKKQQQEMIWKVLISSKCADCGETDPLVLEFDHVSGNKKFSIGEIARMGYALSTLKKEIEKCEVRCANCHMKRHILNNRTWRIQMLEETV